MLRVWLDTLYFLYNNCLLMYAMMNHQKIHFPDVLEAWKVVTWTKGIYIMKSKKGLDF